MDKENLRKKIDMLNLPFPSELPDIDMKPEFDLEDTRIVGNATKFLEGIKINKLEIFDPDLKKIILDYKPLDEEAKRIHLANMKRLKVLEEVIVLVNKSIDEERN